MKKIKSINLTKDGINALRQQICKRVHSIKVEAIREFYDYQVPEDFGNHTLFIGDHHDPDTVRDVEQPNANGQDQPIWSGFYMANWHISHEKPSNVTIGYREWLESYDDALEIKDMFYNYISPGMTDVSLGDANYNDNPNMYVSNTAPYAAALEVKGDRHGSPLHALENGARVVRRRIARIVKRGIKNEDRY